MKLAFTASARSDLARLRAFIAEKNPVAAATIARRLRESISRLVDNLKLGHAVLESDHVRDWISGPYVVRYLVKDEQVIILRVWHGREDR